MYQFKVSFKLVHFTTHISLHWERELIKEREKNMTSFMANASNIERKWYVIDAKGKALGRVASKAAVMLKGKHKATFTPHVDCGDNIIIINAKEVMLTGNKLDQKIYYNHSGWTGGLRQRTAKEMLENYPVEMVERAVKGMLPKGRLGRQMYKKLFVYEGPDHKHQAQKPETIEL